MINRQIGGHDVALKRASNLAKFVKVVFITTVLSTAVTFLFIMLTNVPLSRAYDLFEYGLFSLVYDTFQDPKHLILVKQSKAKLLQYESAYYLAISLAAIVGTIACFLCIFVLRKMGIKYSATNHIRGAQLNSTKTLNRELKKLTRLPFLNGYNLGKLSIPEEYVWRNFAIIGRPGSGKSNLIKHMLMQDRKRPHVKAFIIDINGEYWQRFGNPSKDKILGLNFPESEKWNFWNEPVPPELMASYLVPELHHSNPFFWKAARIFITSMLKRNMCLKGLSKDLKKSDAILLQELSQTSDIALKVLGKEDSGQTKGVMASAILHFSFLEDLIAQQARHPDEKPFSIVNWCLDPNDTSWIFVPIKEDELAKAAPLVACWFNLAIQGCLKRDEKLCNSGHYPSIRFFLDEIKSIGKLEEFERGAERLRKYRGSLITGYQNNAQLEAIYGQHGAENLKDTLQNKWIFSIGDSKANEELSRYLGDHEVLRPNLQDSYGKQHSYSQAHYVVSERLVSASEIGNMKDGECIIKIGHFNPIKAEMPFAEFDPITSPLIHRAPKNEVKTEGVLKKDNENDENSGILTPKSPHVYFDASEHI